jgi:DNA-binding NarL/FixJ family response regulator
MSAALAAGADVPEGVPLLAKPLSAGELISAVQAALERSAQARKELRLATQRSVQILGKSRRLTSATKEVIENNNRLIEASLEVLNRPISVPLSNRERQVLKLIGAGLSTKQVAEALGVSFKTACSHRHHILTKLGVHETVLAVRWAIRNGLIEP